MIITQTPLRISFGGGGTDLPDYFERHEGFVINAAIDKAVFVIVSARYDEKIYVNYSRKEIVDHVDDIHHELVREAMKSAKIGNGVEVTLLSDIPSEGSGLGSSSSFTVGLLNAFHIYQSRQVGPEELAREACEIEIQRCRKPIGKQDQYIAAYGGIAAFTFNRDGSVKTEKLQLSDKELRYLSSRLLLFYSGQVRSSAEILAEQRRRAPENAEQLERIKSLGVEVRAAIEGRNFGRVGPLLDENWRLKKSLAAPISNGDIEEMRAQAMDAGAAGCKICGAGGGGFLLVYCSPDRQERLLAAMEDYRRMPFAFEPDGSKVIFNYRRASWK